MYSMRTGWPNKKPPGGGFLRNRERNRLLLGRRSGSVLGRFLDGFLHILGGGVGGLAGSFAGGGAGAGGGGHRSRSSGVNSRRGGRSGSRDSGSSGSRSGSSRRRFFGFLATSGEGDGSNQGSQQKRLFHICPQSKGRTITGNCGTPPNL